MIAGKCVGGIRFVMTTEETRSLGSFKESWGDGDVEVSATVADDVEKWIWGHVAGDEYGCSGSLW